MSRERPRPVTLRHPLQRQVLPEIATRISSSVGFEYDEYAAEIDGRVPAGRCAGGRIEGARAIRVGARGRTCVALLGLGPSQVTKVGDPALPRHQPALPSPSRSAAHRIDRTIVA
jgi:hypothetical protein